MKNASFLVQKQPNNLKCCQKLCKMVAALLVLVAFRLVVLLVLGIMLLVLLKLLVLLEVVGIRADKSADRFEKK